MTGALVAFRERIAKLYSGSEAGPERGAARAALEAQARVEIASLDLLTRDAQAFAEGVPLNDACQALTGTYYGDLTRYEERFRELQGDLGAFLEGAQRAAEEPDPRSSPELTPGRHR